MKRLGYILIAAGTLGLTMLLNSCGTSVYVAQTGGAYSDDLYETHDRKALAEAERQERAREEAYQAEREKKIQAMVAAARADSDIDNILGDETVSSNPYEDILADDYESAYQRRLRGFSSPTYRMPSSYFNYRYSDAYFLTMAYDPAFYNVIVMGDEVWVEPRYVSNMFGSWGRPYWYNRPYGYYGYYGYGYGYGYWDPYWSPYGNYYYSWGWDPYWDYPYYGGGWYGPHRPHYPPYHGGGHGYHNDKVVHHSNLGTGIAASSRSTQTSRSSYENRINQDRSSRASVRSDGTSSRSSSVSSSRSSSSYRDYDNSSNSSSSRSSYSSGTSSRNSGNNSSVRSNNSSSYSSGSSSRSSGSSYSGSSSRSSSSSSSGSSRSGSSRR